MPRQSWKVANPRLVCNENDNYPLNVKKELEIIAEALIDSSQFSGTKSVEVETPALKAAADDERSVLVGEMYTRVFPHVAKMLDFERTRYPTNSNPCTSNIWSTDYEEDCTVIYNNFAKLSVKKTFFTNLLSTVRLHNCLGPPESRNSRSGGRRQGMVDLFPANRTRRGTRRALRILSYLRWRDACLNRFNRGCMGTISIAVNFCVVRVVEFLRNAKLFQSLLASQRVLQCLLLRFFLAELRHSLTILLTVLFELLRAFPSLGH